MASNLCKHEELEVVLRGNGEFSKNLYAILSRSPGNVLFSPISIHAILSLTYQGARGQTQEAMSKTLNIADEKIAALGYKEVMTRFSEVKDVDIYIANKICLKDTYELQSSFNSVANKEFLSEVDLIDFRQATAVAESINAWVEDKTANKIKDIFKPDDITEDTALVLVNAIYFKGKWVYPFNKVNRKVPKFYLNDIDTMDAQMMYRMAYYYYKDDKELGAQVLQMPYMNDHYNMIVILPNERNGIAELEEKLANTDLTKITDNLSLEEVDVYLPKFTFEQTIDLQDALTELGLGVIFNEDADFSGIIKSPQPLCVRKIVQKVFIEVNESGTEAAAATRPIMYEMCFKQRKHFIADHPFVIILTAGLENSNSIIFQGRISNPQTLTLFRKSIYW